MSAGMSRYDFNESNFIRYLQSPLRRVLLLVQFLLSEALKGIYVEAVENFAAFFEARTPGEYAVDDSVGECDALFVTEVMVSQREVVKEAPPAAEEEGKPAEDRKPEIEYVPCFAFTRTPAGFAEAAEDIYNKSIVAVDNLSSVERLLFPNMMRDGELSKGFRDDDQWVEEGRSRVRASILTHETWLDEYLRSFKDLEDVLAIDVEAELEEYRSSEEPVSANEVKKIVAAKLRRREEVLMRLPACSVRIGMFEIGFGEIAQSIAEKLLAVAEGILRIEGDKLKGKMTAEVQPKYDEVFGKLACEIPDIETVSEMTEFLNHLPAEVAKVEGEVEECVEMYEAVGTFGTIYELDKATLDLRWIMYGRPGEIVSRATKLSEKLSADREKFCEEQASSQDTFEGLIDNLEEEVMSFSMHDKLGDVEKVSGLLEDLQGRLEAAVNQARLFNSRETLFNRDTTDYSRLGKICRDFEPYVNLWRTAFNWHKNKIVWRKGPFGDVDARHCEGEVNGGIKLMYKTIRKLKEDASLQSICSIAEQVRKELEDFKPYVPVV
ncbi:Dynein heavy chain 1, axonemal, partial [Perkinsus olseni]